LDQETDPLEATQLSFLLKDLGSASGWASAPASLRQMEATAAQNRAAQSLVRAFERFEGVRPQVTNALLIVDAPMTPLYLRELEARTPLLRPSLRDLSLRLAR
jgi:hypothetical protein